MMWEPAALQDARNGLDMLDFLGKKVMKELDDDSEPHRAYRTELQMLMATTAQAVQAFAATALVEAMCMYGESIVTRLERIEAALDSTRVFKA